MSISYIMCMCVYVGCICVEFGMGCGWYVGVMGVQQVKLINKNIKKSALSLQE